MNDREAITNDFDSDVDSETLTDNSDYVENGNEPTDNEGDNSSQQNDQEPDKNNDDATADHKNQSKFATLEEATKAHAELQKKLGLQSNELGDLRKQAEEAKQLRERIANLELQEAKNKGFETVKDYQTSKEEANFTANEYAKYIEEVEYPDEMIKMLKEYRDNPSSELLDAIESRFSVETIKNVAGQNAIFKGQLAARENQALEEQVTESARAYLNENVLKYKEEFNNPAFAALYGEAFRAYGCDLQTDKFVELMKNYADSVIKANGMKNKISKENSDETDEIAGLNNSSASNKYHSGKSLVNMSASELDKRLDEII